MSILGPDWDDDEATWLVKPEDRKYIANEPKCKTCNMVLPKTGVCDDCD